MFKWLKKQNAFKTVVTFYRLVQVLFKFKHILVEFFVFRERGIKCYFNYFFLPTAAIQ